MTPTLRMRHVALCAVSALILAASLSLVGCGTDLGSIPDPSDGSAVGPDQPTTGGLTFAVQFPEASAEMIPAATQSIRVVVKRLTNVLADRVLTRANPTTTITGITSGWSVTDTVTAHATTDGTGTALASGTGTVTIPNGTNATVTITLKSAISRVTLTPAATAVAAGGSVQLVPTAYNLAGAMVLAGNTWQWTSSKPVEFPVATDGTVTANGTGTATITVRQTESLKTARAVIGVGALSATPTSLDFPAAVFAQSLSIRNTGAGTMNWTATSDQTWLKLSAASGTGNTTIQAIADRTSLGLGSHTATVHVAASCGSADIPVTCEVSAPSSITAGPLVAWQTQTGTDRNIAVKRYDGTGSTAVLTTGTLYKDTTPAISADGSRVAWVTSKDPLGDIYTAPADGTGTPVRITSSTAADIAPSLSADGSRVAWVSKRDGNNEIYVANAADGSGVQRISSQTADDSAPCLSGDGSKVAWVSRRNGAADIYVANVTGTEAGMVRVTSATAADTDPSLNYDGSVVAFVTARWGGTHIALASTSGTEQSVARVTNLGTANLEPSLSGDGARVAFTSTRSGTSQVYVASTSGTEVSVWNPQPTKSTSAQPSLSADGEFVSWRSNTTGNTEVYAALVAVGTPVNLSQNTTGDDSYPSSG